MSGVKLLASAAVFLQRRALLLAAESYLSKFSLSMTQSPPTGHVIDSHSKVQAANSDAGITTQSSVPQNKTSERYYSY